MLCKIPKCFISLHIYLSFFRSMDNCTYWQSSCLFLIIKYLTHLIFCIFNSVFSGLWVIVILTFLGNVLVLAAFIYEKKLRTNFNLFILNLALTDILVACTAIPLYATDYSLGYFPFNEVWYKCKLWVRSTSPLPLLGLLPP